MSKQPAFSPSDITGVILAGGLATRMGGADKGLQAYMGKRLVEHVIEKLAPQVGQLLINANRNQAVYAELGLPVIGDEIGNFPGPLAGLHTGLRHARGDWVLTAPCDSPGVPEKLALTLATPCQAGARLAIARHRGRLHPVFCLCHRSILSPLENYLKNDGRRVAAWCQAMGASIVDFPDEDGLFTNFNTLADLGLAPPLGA